MNDLFLKFLELFFGGDRGTRGMYTSSAVSVAALAAPILAVAVWDVRIWVAGIALGVGLILAAAAWFFTFASNI
jgi:hypothetical protein